MTRMVMIAIVWVAFSSVLSCAPDHENFGGTHNNATILVKKDYTQERNELKAKAATGDVQAMVDLGKTYCCGSSSVNLPLATYWLCEAAAKNSGDAMYQISALYAGHRSVENLPLALAYAEKARAQGNVEALSAKVGLMKRLLQDEIAEGLKLANDPALPCRIEQNLAQQENAATPAPAAPSPETEPAPEPGITPQATEESLRHDALEKQVFGAAPVSSAPSLSSSAALPEPSALAVSRGDEEAIIRGEESRDVLDEQPDSLQAPASMPYSAEHEVQGPHAPVPVSPQYQGLVP